MIDEVLETLGAVFGKETPVKKDGYINIPKDHIFASWRIAHKTADGADGYNMFWRVTYELRIFYRDGKKSADIQKELLFEDGLRECQGLECDYDYDSNDKLDFTTYSFIGIVDF